MTELVLTDTELRVRKDFSKIPPILDIPDLIEIQKQTFERFLQTHVEPEKRENSGLQAVFNCPHALGGCQMTTSAFWQSC